MPRLSIVIPLFNEEAGIPALRERLQASLREVAADVELLFVDDGSRDATAQRIKEWIDVDPRVCLVQLSRNFGHQAAITAGLKESTGQVVVIMDGDLQDPPEVIPQLFEEWRKGHKVVLAARRSRQEEGGRKIFFQAFYKIFEVLSDLPAEITGVFGLMDRVVVEHILSMNERHRFLPGLRSWVGFSQGTVWYDRQARQSGKTKQSLRRLIRYALDAIFSFSNKPLRVSFALGFIVSVFSFGFGMIVLVKRLLNIDVVHGFTTMAAAIFFLGGVILMSNGIIGEYLGRIYDEVKARPLYIIARKYFKENSGGPVKSREYEREYHG